MSHGGDEVSVELLWPSEGRAERLRSRSIQLVALTQGREEVSESLGDTGLGASWGFPPLEAEGELQLFQGQRPC